MKSAMYRLVSIGLALLASTMAARAEWPVTAFNPAASTDDLVLPMPCGGAMAFRKIAVPDAGILEDYRVVLGSLEQERGHAEYRWSSWVAGSFQDSSGGTRHYYIGKYEVSALQMAALGASCPDAGKVDLQKPATRVTWSEASLFAERYSDWLIRNFLDDLPTEEGVPGFLRLPTETEWEFAARGAMKVSRTEFAERLPFPASAIDEHVVHDGNSYRELDLIGTREPNPAGLHDILGNAAELTVNPFRLNAVSHLHGRAGGYVVRGGSYRTRKSEIRLSHREEFAPVDRKGIRRLDTVGFRVVLVAPALPSRQSIESAQKAWEALPEEEAAQEVDRDLAAEQSDPVREARALAEAAPNAEMRRRLENLSGVIAESIKTRNEQRSRAIRELLHGASLAANLLTQDIGRLRFLRQSAKSAPEGRLKELSEARVRKSEEAFDFNLAYYLDRLPVLADDYGQALLEREGEVLKGHYRERGLGGLSAALQAVLGHVETNRRLGPSARSTILKSLDTLARSAAGEKE
jgi:formylglycine-generating enzyme required for sulfatase activity